MDLDEIDLKLLKAAQDGIEMTDRPYLALGQKLGLSEEEVIDRIKAMIVEGAIRRFAAAIGHRALGIVANAMIVWNVSPSDVQRAGEIVASFAEVTHCYERDKNPEWPYNLYAMVHSRNRSECLEVASLISAALGIDDYQVLFSEEEYKKTSARI
jgi:siroheme decarboxylase